MPTVLSKHNGELFGKRINVKVNSQCQKGQMVHLTGLWVVVPNSKLSYNKKFLNISSSISYYLTYEEKNN